MRRKHSIVLAAVLALASGHAADAGQSTPERFRIDPLTSSISGRVTSETGGPLRRAEVRAISEGGLTRLATSDADGRYLVRDLPAGVFTLHVSKSGFVPLYFGQRRPFEPRDTIRLTQGQRFAADVRLPRAGAISGRIVDSTGEPVMGTRVQAFRTRMVDGLRGLQSVGAADTTDDTGAYRLYGLAPGDYYVTAMPRQIEDRSGRPIGAAVPGRGAPIFYPGTANRDEAQRIAVTVSGEARADMLLSEVRTSRVSGVVLTTSGTPAAGAMITLLSRDMDFMGSSANEAMSPLRIQDDAAADGSFELTGVPPGSFVLRAQTRPNLAFLDITNQLVTKRPVGQPEFETALVPVTVNGDVAGLTVTTFTAGRLDIVVVADDGVTAQLPGIGISMRSEDRRSESMMMTMAGSTGSNSTRTALPESKLVAALPGPARVTVERLPTNWTVKAITLDGEDVTDRPVDLKSRQQATLRIVLTDRVTTVVGSITSSSFGDAVNARQATVVVFADDDKRWTFPSRFIRTTRAGDKGTFQLSGLPPNQEYRAIAVDYLEDGEETDPDFLKRMRDRATGFSLREAETRTLELRLINR